MQEQEKEILITHMSNVNVANNYMCNNGSTLDSRYINNTVNHNAETFQLISSKLYSSRHWCIRIN